MRGDGAQKVEVEGRSSPEEEAREEKHSAPSGGAECLCFCTVIARGTLQVLTTSSYLFVFKYKGFTNLQGGAS